jgi:hypothetical protein
VTRDTRAKVLTVALIAAIGVFLVMRQQGTTMSDVLPEMPAAKADPTPQDAIYAMLDAAREGDVDKYLGFYTGQMEVSLKQAVSESGRDGFAKYLKDTNAPIKGIAINEPQPLTDREVKARVEYVYQDRNEVQIYYLEKQDARWKIARLETAERVKTLVPYGTPVQ